MAHSFDVLVLIGLIQASRLTYSILIGRAVGILLRVHVDKTRFAMQLQVKAENCG